MLLLTMPSLLIIEVAFHHTYNLHTHLHTHTKHTQACVSCNTLQHNALFDSEAPAGAMRINIEENTAAGSSAPAAVATGTPNGVGAGTHVKSSSAKPAPSSPSALLSRQEFKRRFRRRYTAHYVSAEAIVKGGLLVSASMFSDHMPDKQFAGLVSCRRQ